MSRQQSTAAPQEVGAIYTRFSSRHQHSTADQIRACREWAERNGVHVPAEYIFCDEAVTGRSSRRKGLASLIEALNDNRVHTAIFFATNRLYRNTAKALAFVDEEIVEREKRAVFVSSGIDTSDERSWKSHLTLLSVIDETQLRSMAEHIRASHEGLFLEGRVWGTLPYGYVGEVVEGRLTRNGKPVRKTAIESEAAEWVKKIFMWYVEEKSSLREIARRMNQSAAPKRACGHPWVATAVRRLLSNARYRGEWAYGRMQSVWLNKKNYLRPTLRNEPLKLKQDESLRIIDDPTWYAAQELLQKNAHNAGRKPPEERKDNYPRLLNRLLICETHRQALCVTGHDGQYMYCPSCRRGDSPELFSYFPRQLATELFLKKISRIMLDEPTLAEEIVRRCQACAEAMEAPGEAELSSLHMQSEKLTRRIQFIMQSPGETEEDLTENQGLLRQLRAERATIQRRLSEADAAAERKKDVPTKESVLSMLEKLHRIAAGDFGSLSSADAALLRNFVVDMTGGEIVVSQQGDRRKNHGWLRMTFSSRLAEAGKRRFGFACPEDVSRVVTIDVRSTERDEAAERVKELYDQGLMMKEIQAELGCGRVYVRSLLRHWSETHGEAIPDGRKRRIEMDRKTTEEPLYRRLSEEAAKLWNEGETETEIAERLKCSRPTVALAVRHWRKTYAERLPQIAEGANAEVVAHNISLREERQLRNVRRALDLYEQGMAIKRIANELGYSPRGVTLLLQRELAASGREFCDGRTRRFAKRTTNERDVQSAAM